LTMRPSEMLHRLTESLNETLLSSPKAGYGVSFVTGSVSFVGSEVVIEAVFKWLARAGIVVSLSVGVLTFMLQLRNWRNRKK